MKAGFRACRRQTWVVHTPYRRTPSRERISSQCPGLCHLPLRGEFLSGRLLDEETARKCPKAVGWLSTLNEESVSMNNNNNNSN